MRNIAIVMTYDNPLTAERALRALIDFTLSNARRFYSSMGNPLDGKGIITETDFHKGFEKPQFIKETFASSVYPHQLT